MFNLRKLRRSAHFKNIRQDLQAALVEFVGTTFFLLLGLGGIQSTTAAIASAGGSTSTLELTVYISTCMGFSLLVSAWLFFRITGGLFNPNVALSLMLVGILPPVRFVLYCIAELLGSIAASALIMALNPGPLSVNTILQADINVAQGVFIEMFITTALVLAVLMLAEEKHTATPFAPIGIGLTAFAAHLWATWYTGASMNTARSFGPAVVTGFPDSKHWVYWVGPCLGSFVGSAFYAILKHYKYWQFNPNQCATDSHLSPQGVKPVDVLKRAMPLKMSLDTTRVFRREKSPKGSKGSGESSQVTGMRASVLRPQVELDLEGESQRMRFGRRRARMNIQEVLVMENALEAEKLRKLSPSTEGAGNDVGVDGLRGMASHRRWSQSDLPELPPVQGVAGDFWNNDSPV
ncbi:hypothetical protein HWV62_17507 [Athelia sp. TMB]|nr:hypothetical protein HWV62_32934 [Athelia sp. TMB]KAF7984012.1 hypothetical protein HWV62_17507 [Athelia sp. TMB]